MTQSRKLSELFARKVDADTHYHYHRPYAMYRSSHCGTMNSVDRWMLVNTADKSNVMQLTPILNARGLIVTADREGIMLNKRGADPIFVAYPKRGLDEFEVEAKGMVNRWLDAHVGEGVRLVCLYKRPEEAAETVQQPASQPHYAHG